MKRRRQIYEGKAKILYEGPEPGTLIQYFKDDATAFNAQKKGTISGKMAKEVFEGMRDLVFDFPGFQGARQPWPCRACGLPSALAGRWIWWPSILKAPSRMRLHQGTSGKAEAICAWEAPASAGRKTSRAFWV